MDFLGLIRLGFWVWVEFLFQLQLRCCQIGSRLQHRKAHVPIHAGADHRRIVLLITSTLMFAWENQNDHASGTGYRECFSSSCTMLARYDFAEAH